MSTAARQCPRAGRIRRSLACLTLVWASAAHGFTPDAKQTAVLTESGADLEAIAAAIVAAGSSITHSIAVPTGGTLLSVDQPSGSTAVNEFHSQLRGLPGVKTVEDNACVDIYPVDNPSALVTLHTTEHPDETPENLLAGGTVPWVNTAITVSSEHLFSVVQTDPAPLQTTTRTRDVTLQASGWSQGREYPPTITPDTFTQACQAPTIKEDAGPKPVMKLAYGKPADFPYPRPIPLQLKVRDYDFVQVTCEGCGGGQSLYRKPIEDDIAEADIEWAATNLGALNEPFVDIVDLEAIEEEIERLRKLIRQLSEELEKKIQEKEEADRTRADRLKALDEEIARLEADKAEAEREKTQAADELKELEDRLARKQRELQEAMDEIDSLQEKIGNKEEEIEELRNKIAGEPSPEEEALARQLEEVQRQIEEKLAELANMDADHQARAQALQAAVDQARQALDSARQQLAAARAQVQAQQDRITALERQLYANPLLRDFMTLSQDALRTGQQLASDYLSDSGLPVSPANEVTSQATQVLQSPPSSMQAAFDTFSASRDQLLSNLASQCMALGGAEAAACNDGVEELARQLDEISNKLQEAIANPQSLVDPDVWNQLQAAKAQLANLEANVQTAEQAVEAAEQALQQALQAQISGLQQLRQERQALLDEIDQLRAEEQRLIAELAEATRQKELEREAKTPQWIADIAQLRTEIEELLSQVADQRRKAQTLQEEIDKLKSEIELKKARIQELQARIEYLQRQIEAKRAEKEAISTEEDDLQKEIDDLKARLEQAKKDLEAAEAREFSATNKNKSASGRLVYYIPPPLEMILSPPKQTEFTRLKREVGRTEGEFEEAVGKKANLQDRAFQIIKGFTEQLWALKSAQDTIEKLTDEITQAETDKRQLQADAEQENLQKQREAEAEKDRLKQEKREAESKAEEARNEEEREKTDVDLAQQQVDTLEQEIDQAKQRVNETSEQVSFQRNMRRTKEETLEQLKATHEQTAEKMRTEEADLGRINDAIARQSAAGNEAGVANLREAARAAQQQLDSTRATFESEQTRLKAAGDDLKLAVVAENEAWIQAEAAAGELQRLERELRRARQNLRKQTEELDKYTEQRLSAERDVRLADDAVKDQEEALRKVKEASSENQDIEDKDKEIAKKKEELSKAEVAKNKAEIELKKLTELREEWKQDLEKADNEVGAARAAMQAARQSLKTFITNEFNNVSYTESITLTVKDGAPLDQWRTGGEDADRTIIVQYAAGGDGRTTVVRGAGSRTPKVIFPDDDLAPPAEVHNPALCDTQFTFEKKDPIKEADGMPKLLEPDSGLNPEPVRLKGVEPQTIALFYRQGEPLYELWPPRRDTEHKLQRAATHWETGASDLDQFTVQCSPGGGTAISVGVPGPSETTAPQACGPGQASTNDIADMAHAKWNQPVSITDREEMRLHLRVPDVPADKCDAEADIKLEYTNLDSDITEPLEAADEKITGNEKIKGIKPGMVGDLTRKVRGFDGENKVQLRIQLFDGEHKGLDREKIKWSVLNARPDIAEDKYGLDSGKVKELVKETEGGGYSKVDFYLEEQFGKAEVKVQWLRGEEPNQAECKTETIEIERLLAHRMIYKGFGAQGGWDVGVELFVSSDTDPAKYLAKLPEEGADKLPMISTGLLDDHKDPVLEKKIEFDVPSPAEARMDPTEFTTEEDSYALAWSFAKDVPEDSQISLVARVESKLTEFVDEEPPSSPEHREELSGKTANMFKIGVEGAYITIETEAPFVPGGDPYTGGAKIYAGAATDILKKFVNLPLQADGIVTNELEGEEIPVAQQGTVTWSVEEDSGALTFDRVGITLLVKQLGLSAGADGIVGGKVNVPTVPAPNNMAEFTAVIGPKGFYGEVNNFPEIQMAGMRLEKGASVAIDMHQTKDPEFTDSECAVPDREPVKDQWNGQGLYVRTAKIFLPEALKGDAENPPAISATNLQVTAVGVTGCMSLEYLVSASIGKLKFSINKVSLALLQNEPTGTEIHGGLTFPDPFIGEANVVLKMARGNQYSLTVDTEKPVSAPKLGLVFTIQQMTGEYKESVFSFSVVYAGVRSEKFSDINIENFKFDSTGNISAEKIEINQDVKLGRGFEAHLKSIGFKLEGSEYELSLETGFQFGDFLKAEEVSIKVVTGPAIAEFDLEVTGEKKPVTFDSEIHYKADLFEGELQVDVENLFNIKGIFVLGAKKTNDEEWSYWYIELNLEAEKGIVIPYTGMSLLGIGGGLGYNYDPPVGMTEGAARKTDAFSFKASIVLGNTPGGEVFMGRLTMVLTSGRFTLNGKVWLLEKEDSLFGEGQVSLYYESPARLEGYLRMVVALPTAEGKLLRFNGIVDFYYGGDRQQIKSRQLEGSILERIIAEGNIDVTPGNAHLEGSLRYDLYKEVPLAVVTVKVQLNLRADASLDIVVSSAGASLDALANFNGNWDVNLYTAVKEFDIVSGSVSADLTLSADTSGTVSASGSVSVSWDTWVHSGNTDVELGFSL